MTDASSRLSDRTAEPVSARGRWAFLLTPSWIAIILTVVTFSVACFAVLAPWQFGRHGERSAQNAAIAAAAAQDPVPVTTLMSDGAEPAGDAIWRSATATGVFVPERQVFARLRQNEAGEPVSQVVVPLQLDEGAWVLIDRGYVSFEELRRGDALPDLPSGTVTVTGRVRPTETDPRGRPPVDVDGRIEVYSIDPSSTAFAAPAGAGGAPAGVPLRGYLQVEAGSPGVLEPVGVPRADAGPFLSYALQWLAFGVIALVGIVVFVRREVSGTGREAAGTPHDRLRDRLYDQPDDDAFRGDDGRG